MADIENPTDEQATAALEQLSARDLSPDGDQELNDQGLLEPPAEEQPKVEAGAGDDQPPETEGTEAGEPQEDDPVAIAVKEAEERLTSRFEDQRKVDRERSSQNEKILRDRILRHGSANSQARELLETALKDPDGFTREAAERVVAQLRGSVNPQSSSFEPAPAATPSGSFNEAEAREDQALALNTFLNDVGLSKDEQDEFGKWVTSEGRTALSEREQAVAGVDLGAYLTIAHNRWTASRNTQKAEAKRSATTDAVRAVQRVQKAAARAGAPASSTRKPAASAAAARAGTIDIAKLTPNDVSKLVRESAERHM